MRNMAEREVGVVKVLVSIFRMFYALSNLQSRYR